LPLLPLLIGVVAVVVALRGGGDGKTIELTSSAPDLGTVEELIAASDLVVAATVAEVADGRQITAPADPQAAVVTRLLVLDVSDVFAGAADGDVIVEEPATLGDGTPVVVDGMPPLDVGDEAVWFLVAGDDEAMPYFAVVNRQGRYTVAGDSLHPASDDPLSSELAALGLKRLAAVVDRMEPSNRP
jgi:hypothetical protein